MLEEYRNKCEFNVGLDLSGKLSECVTSYNSSAFEVCVAYTLFSFCLSLYLSLSLYFYLSLSLIAVGFRIGTYEKGDLSVASPETCIHVPRRMKQIAAVSCRLLSG